MNGNRAVTAGYTQNEYTLTITSQHGTVTKNPDKATYTYGEAVQLTAVPAAGWSFAGWSGDATGTTNPVTVTMNGNRAVTAGYTQNEYILTVNVVGNGSVTREPNQAVYHYGDTVTLTATANTDWVFSTWSGDLTGSVNPAVITMNASKTVTATFTKVLPTCYALTLSHTGQGTDPGAEPTHSDDCPSGQFISGAIIELNGAVPEAGWQIGSWSGTDSDASTASTNSVTMPAAAHSAQVNYTQSEYNLIVTISGSGTVTRNNNGPYHFGDVITLTAVPTAGWSFGNWSGDITGTTNPATILINDNKAVTAVFVDTTAPETSLTAYPPNPSDNHLASFTFSGTDNLTPAGNLIFECRLDSTPWAICTSPKSYTSLASGAHTFAVRAADAAGNVDATPAVYTWTVITGQAPVANAGGPYTGSEGAAVYLSAAQSTDPENNIVSYQWDLDEDGLFDDAIGKTAKFKAVDNGTYTVQVRVTDASGLSSTDDATVTIKNVPPTITSLKSNRMVRAESKVNIIATFKDPGSLDTFTAAWKWGDGTTSTGAVSSKTVTGSHIYTKPGVYLISLMITDKDGGVAKTSYWIVVLAKR